MAKLHKALALALFFLPLTLSAQMDRSAIYKRILDTERFTKGMDTLERDFSAVNPFVDTVTAFFISRPDISDPRSTAVAWAETHLTDSSDSTSMENYTYGSMAQDLLATLLHMGDGYSAPGTAYDDTDKGIAQALADLFGYEITYGPVVRECVNTFTVGSKRSFSQYAKARYRKYMGDFEEIFERSGVPRMCAWLCVIESCFNAKALSPAGAYGMWQFMEATARDYGLRVDYYVDERENPWKACQAAAQYFKDAYKTLGSWEMAMASYNCGVGGVQYAMQRAGSARYADIFPYLPAETRMYVPSIYAVAYAVLVKGDTL